jgi:hypothetical protein
MAGSGHGLPLPLRWQYVRCTQISYRPASLTKSVALGHKRPFTTAHLSDPSIVTRRTMRRWSP